MSEWDLLKEKFQRHFEPVIREECDLKAFRETMVVIDELKVIFNERNLTQKEAMQIFLYSLTIEAFKRLERLERRIVCGKDTENL